MTNGSLIRSEVLQNAPFGAFCNTFDLHKAIIGPENQFSVFLRVAVYTDSTLYNHVINLGF